jgi:hypothetical protein
MRKANSRKKMNPKIIQGSTSYLFRSISLFVVLTVGFTVYYSKFNALGTIVIIVAILAILFVYLYQDICLEFQFNENNLTIKKLNFLKIEIIDIEYTNLSYSYRKALVGRGRLEYSLFIYFQNRALFNSNKDSNGWTEEKVKEIIAKLKENEVKVQKGYKT